MSDLTQQGEALLKSHWPACVGLADALAEDGSEEAVDLLVKALKVKRHHVRSAAIKALAKIGDASLLQHIQALLEDSSYEVRMDAKEAVFKLTGVAVRTGRGE